MEGLSLTSPLDEELQAAPHSLEHAGGLILSASLPLACHASILWGLWFTTKTSSMSGLYDYGCAISVRKAQHGAGPVADWGSAEYRTGACRHLASMKTITLT